MIPGFYTCMLPVSHISLLITFFWLLHIYYCNILGYQLLIKHDEGVLSCPRGFGIVTYEGRISLGKVVNGPSEAFVGFPFGTWEEVLVRMRLKKKLFCFIVCSKFPESMKLYHTWAYYIMPKMKELFSLKEKDIIPSVLLSRRRKE